MTAAASAATAGEPPAKRARTAGPWEQLESVAIRDYGAPSVSSVAAFDMDSTLILTKSGKTFPTSKDDWQLWSPRVKTKLHELHASGHKIVIVTNQGGISKGKTTLADMQAKLDNVQKALDVPLLVLMLTKDDIYRKPLPTIWKLLETKYNGGVPVSKAASFYCGDAAGRVPPVVKKKDFSASDLKFALNIGVRFETPEELFHGKSQTYERERFEFDPRKLGVSPVAFPFSASSLGGKALVICVGAPGSGKSNLATVRLSAFERVNQDTLKTKTKCLKVCEDALKAGKSVVVDNQNKTKADRAPYIALAKKLGAKAIAVLHDVPKEACFHFNAYRRMHTQSHLHREEKVPDMVIHSYYKSLQKPAEAEGFDSVHRVGLEHFEVNEDTANLELLRSFLS